MAFRYIWYTGYPALTDIPTVQTLVKVTVIKAHWGPGDGLDREGVGERGIKAGPARFWLTGGGWQRHSLRPRALAEGLGSGNRHAEMEWPWGHFRRDVER